MQMFKCHVFTSRGKYPKNVSGSFLGIDKLFINSVQQILLIKTACILPSSRSSEY